MFMQLDCCGAIPGTNCGIFIAAAGASTGPKKRGTDSGREQSGAEREKEMVVEGTTVKEITTLLPYPALYHTMVP